MIKYKLVCKNCDNFFDSWFASSKEFEKLKKLNFLNCHSCNSFNIDKSLMTPSLFNTKKNKINTKDIKHKEIKKKNKRISEICKR